ncbi:unnamed protein product, partial [Nesidiocoris tenuis]
MEQQLSCFPQFACSIKRRPAEQSKQTSIRSPAIRRQRLSVWPSRATVPKLEGRGR